MLEIVECLLWRDDDQCDIVKNACVMECGGVPIDRLEITLENEIVTLECRGENGRFRDGDEPG